MENTMRKIRLQKITLSCGTGTAPGTVDKAFKLLSIISNKTPVKTSSNKRIPAFNVRPGLAIGCKITIRGKEAIELLKRLLNSIGNKLQKKQFNPGSFAVGIKEYIEIPGMVYHRDIGIMGFAVNVTLERAGFRVNKRRGKKGKVPNRHRITMEETEKFMEDNFKTTIEQKDLENPSQ